MLAKSIALLADSDTEVKCSCIEIFLEVKDEVGLLLIWIENFISLTSLVILVNIDSVRGPCILLQVILLCDVECSIIFHNSANFLSKGWGP